MATQESYIHENIKKAMVAATEVSFQISPTLDSFFPESETYNVELKLLLLVGLE